MVKRDKRNINKVVEIIDINSVLNGRKGIIKGFRGDYEKHVPYVNVYLFDTKSIWSFSGKNLRYIN